MNRCRKYKSDKIINNILKNFNLNCGNMEKGYINHKCLECKEEYIHGFICKTKFCSKCGRMYSLKWSDKQVDNMLDVTHRHAVFTISEELKNYFYKTLVHDVTLYIKIYKRR